MLQGTRTPLPTDQPPRRGRLATAALRLAQIVLAVQFAAAGTLKLAGNPAMVRGAEPRRTANTHSPAFSNPVGTRCPTHEA